eukprot:COSAG01_NODE_29874_length_627_cov_29.634470_1_plen_105_part_00
MTAIAARSPPMLIRSLRRPPAENRLPGCHSAVAGGATAGVQSLSRRHGERHLQLVAVMCWRLGGDGPAPRTRSGHPSAVAQAGAVECRLTVGARLCVDAPAAPS